jgi:hypothetical protein
MAAVSLLGCWAPGYGIHSDDDDQGPQVTLQTFHTLVAKPTLHMAKTVLIGGKLDAKGMCLFLCARHGAKRLPGVSNCSGKPTQDVT